MCVCMVCVCDSAFKKWRTKEEEETKKRVEEKRRRKYEEKKRRREEEEKKRRREERFLNSYISIESTIFKLNLVMSI